MKRLYICAVIMAAVVGLSFWSLAICVGRAQEVSALVAESNDAFVAGDFESSVMYAENALKRWEELTKSLLFIGDHEQTKDIVTELSEMVAFARVEDDQFYSKSYTSRQQLKIFCEKQFFNTQNIL